jgi:hypothetical protein
MRRNLDSWDAADRMKLSESFYDALLIAVVDADLREVVAEGRLPIRGYGRNDTQAEAAQP